MIGIFFPQEVAAPGADADICGVPVITPDALGPSPISRIVGGQEAKPHSWPWHASIEQRAIHPERDQGALRCGATIIGRQTLLTTAECALFKINSEGNFSSTFVVRVGDYNRSTVGKIESVHNVSHVTVHPNYNGIMGNLDYDIAILHLQNPLEFIDEVSPICLPRVDRDPKNGEDCVATGFGTTQSSFTATSQSSFAASSRTLQQITLQTVSRKICSDNYVNQPSQLTDRMICASARGKDTCQGDGGGPLVWRSGIVSYELIGITSWGSGCGLIGKPGVFVRVGSFVRWVLEHSNDNSIQCSGSETQAPTVVTMLTSTTANTETSPIANDSWKVILGSVLCVVFILALLFVAAFLRIRRKRQRYQRGTMKRVEVSRPNHYGFDLRSTCDGNSHIQSILSQYSKLLDVNPKDLEIRTDEMLGRGEFGIVFKGIAHRLPTISDVKGPTVVAVKTTINPADKEQHTLLASEFKVMMKAGRHINIVNILGILQLDKLYMVLEFCQLGSLLMYIRNRRTDAVYSHVHEDGTLLPCDPVAMSKMWSLLCEREDRPPDQTAEKMQEAILSTGDLVKFSHQIARGMEYLTSRCIIHRDLAARNVLVAHHRILKISDFGLAKHGGETYTVSNASVALPILWMPPDALLNREFSEKSDVWSFGILLWEIFSLGQVPFDLPNVVKFSAAAFGEWLLEGHQMARPPGAPLAIYDVMQLCWNLQAADRPNFSTIWKTLDDLVRNAAEESATYLPLDESAETFQLNGDFLELDREMEKYIQKENSTTDRSITQGLQKVTQLILQMDPEA
ncbi:Macrophage colony-stimulating factor 1 receptor 2 [Hypsibius exemplaris]|uniref:Macrophage colony-stimulating factor 1 receptor 2 n=1 Tax=Hypsibius exemplaris TaxID=2072580 RepID=A0A1W0X7L6_HYPEX|nr:Macrophage colony-stimulating factor 1 receptor 2 [Hypsibius exemplaris]